MRIALAVMTAVFLFLPNANASDCSSWIYVGTVKQLDAACIAGSSSGGSRVYAVYKRVCNQYDSRGRFLRQVTESTYRAGGCTF